MSNYERSKFGKSTHRIRKVKLSPEVQNRIRLGCYVLVASKFQDAKVVVRS